jgi:hypothetical protein
LRGCAGGHPGVAAGALPCTPEPPGGAAAASGGRLGLADVIFFGLGLMHGRLDRISCLPLMKGTAWSTYAPCPAGSSKPRVSSGSCHSAVATARLSAGAPFAPMGRPRPWLASMALQVGLNGRCRTSSPPRRRPDHLADASSYRIRPIRRGIGVALHRLDEPAPAALTTRTGPKHTQAWWL